jgi:alkanesulfonate monooxygenase SsuD/methylene tetrahydromethanopterin reductase-like flavin-dependent oxidoreductase (luciferase family)
VFCAETEEEARKMGKRYITQLGVETNNHYYNLGDAAHWDGIKGYEYQLEQAKNGLVGSMDLHLVGTPEQCIERAQRLREVTNCREIVGLFHFGGMSIETAEKSMRPLPRK